ncbi:MAG TPA: hypothetical protein VK927_08880, partial [Adhaeribacter sp.]|nr:hypothetical protein [Adhaeribacter sp.]
FKERKTFDDFSEDARFKQLFMNYNDVAEKFKKKFGNGSYELAAFEKALNDILINKDFEFFISGLTKDDKVVLIRSLQQINKKGVAQFVDAAGQPRGIFATDSVIEEGSSPLVTSQTDGTKVAVDSNEAIINTNATPEEVFMEKTPRRDWLTWLALLTGISALVLAASAKFQDVPGLRNFVSNNYQKRSEAGTAVRPVAVVKSETTTDPIMIKKLDNLTREVEGLYAQMDDLLHKNSVLEQKLAAATQHPKPFDLPKTATPVASQLTNNSPEPANPESHPEAQDLPVTPANFKAPVIQQDELSGEAVPLPEVVFYLGAPDPEGFFWNRDKTYNFVPDQTFFKLTLAEDNAGKGTFEVAANPASQALALSDPHRFLSPVCELSGTEEGAQRIETESPGIIIQNDDQWVLVRKARIRLV